MFWDTVGYYLAVWRNEVHANMDVMPSERNQMQKTTYSIFYDFISMECPEKANL